MSRMAPLVIRKLGMAALFLLTVMSAFAMTELRGSVRACGARVAGAKIIVGWREANPEPGARGNDRFIEKKMETVSEGDGNYRLLLPDTFKEGWASLEITIDRDQIRRNEKLKRSSPKMNLEWEWCHRGDPNGRKFHGYAWFGDGDPAPGVIVRLMCRDSSHAAETDSAGEFRIAVGDWERCDEIHAITDGDAISAHETISDDGRSDYRHDFVGPDLSSLDAKSPKREHQIIIVGSVLDCANKAMQGVIIRVKQFDRWSFALTDANGNYRAGIDQATQSLTLWPQFNDFTAEPVILDLAGEPVIRQSFKHCR